MGSVQRSAVLAIGEFDGFHRGHREVIDATRRLATLAKSIAVAVVVIDASKPDRLTDTPELCELVLAAGADNIRVCEVEPGEDAASLARGIVNCFAPRAVVMSCPSPQNVPRNLRRFRQAIATTETVLVEVPRAKGKTGTDVTSTAVRAELRSGSMERVAELLGRPHTVSGTVIHGQKLGRTIGFATANVALPDGLVHPPAGVYGGYVILPDRTQHRAAINIGHRPTVERDGGLLLEAHLLDFDGDLYGSRLSVQLRTYLRAEQRFESLDALVNQLHKDVARTRVVPL